jgi:hypothetical protein
MPIGLGREPFGLCQGTASTDGHMKLNKYRSPPLTSFSLMQLERVEKPSGASCDGNAGQGLISFSHRRAKFNLHQGVVLASVANKL